MAINHASAGLKRPALRHSNLSGCGHQDGIHFHSLTVSSFPHSIQSGLPYHVVLPGLVRYMKWGPVLHPRFNPDYCSLRPQKCFIIFPLPFCYKYTGKSYPCGCYESGLHGNVTKGSDLVRDMKRISRADRQQCGLTGFAQTACTRQCPLTQA